MTMDAFTWQQLSRIANALERIANVVAPVEPVPLDLPLDFPEDVPMRREHELVKIDGIPAETYPFLPTDPEADTQPIDPKDVPPCEG